MRLQAIKNALKATLLSGLLFTADTVGAQQVRISKLVDANFGTITNFTTDLANSRSLCVYSTKNYQITAYGSGSASAFQLSSGSRTMPYEVQWSATAGQTVGTALLAGTPLINLATSAKNASCSNNPTTSASLIIILRSSNVQAAAAGNYTGTLSLLVAPN